MRSARALSTVVAVVAVAAGCSPASVSQASQQPPSPVGSTAPASGAPGAPGGPATGAPGGAPPSPVTLPGKGSRQSLRQLRDLTQSMADGMTTTSFRVATFNVLGASHTVAGGRHSGFAAGQVRMPWALGLLRSAGVEVAGLQELQPPQIDVLRRLAPGWDLFPTAGAARISRANSITWDSTRWSLLQGHTFPVPYFFGHPVQMPYVLLENRATGLPVWFVNAHNPADAHGPAQQWRAEAVRREANLVTSLAATDIPVVLTGDMNDRADFFCAITALTELHAAAGGDHDGGCHPPAGVGVDWILGTPDVSFDRFVVQRGGLVARTSDHPFLYADVSVGPSQVEGP
ncbi:endonuclease/exonuclease/phosphatase family protein [Nocardioides sp.]|uniref:endonuclease/exonuclease/phosphatase family protein n=1 Tax=Nocardioides sp. TaxID=35761 RepID=UPI003783F89A